MEKIIVCLTGVVNRSIKHTWASIKDNIIDELEKEYEVHIGVFNNNVEGCEVDEVQLNNNDMSVIPHDFLVEYKQSFIDAEIEKIDGHQESASVGYGKNGLRLMYIESKVAEFLENNKDTYKHALVSNADYFYMNKLPLESFRNIGENMIGTCHHWENGDMCTDGFYIACLPAMIRIMNRIEYHYMLIKNYQEPKDLNYERVLNQALLHNNIGRVKVDIFFLKIRANLYLKNSAPEREKYSKMFNDFLEANRDKSESYAFLIDNISA